MGEHPQDDNLNWKNDDTPLDFNGMGVITPFSDDPMCTPTTHVTTFLYNSKRCLVFSPGWCLSHHGGILKSISCINFPMIHHHHHQHQHHPHPTFSFFRDGKGYVWKWGINHQVLSNFGVPYFKQHTYGKKNGVWSNQPRCCRLITIYESWRQPGAINFLRGIVVPLRTAGLTTIHKGPVQTWSFPRPPWFVGALLSSCSFLLLLGG